MKKSKRFKGIVFSILSIVGFMATGAKKYSEHASTGVFIAPGGSILCTVSNLTIGFDTLATGRSKVFLVRTIGASHSELATLYTGASITSKKIYRD